ncbi:TadE/TadG family type IV pilus assembly protein [Auritidibacter ignavus]|uniref:TadE/TadG family type IV pilus assembly protein n=1 Tax=Auritidibacter ignavus TaxID=678932 RepID=UPI00109D7903|nr:hypothetical protein [Auritidibacter ignavus]
MRIASPNRCDQRADEGSATVEFTVLAAVLLVPVIYFLVLIAQIQSAGYATVAAADQGVRMLAQAPDDEQGEQRARASIERTVEDYGIDPDQITVSIHCSPDSCTAPGSLAQIEISTSVGLPLVPSILGNPTSVATLNSVADYQVGEFE